MQNLNSQQNQSSSLASTRLSTQKQSHQIKALFYKTSTLQWKQPCTNLCQIFTPIICLIFTVMIRNVAVENLPTDQNNAYNQVPFFPFKLNDFQIEEEFYDIAFQYDCNRWLLYDWKNNNESDFIGVRNGVNISSGLLRHILKTTSYQCWINESFYPPFVWTQKRVPYFKTPRNSINQDIYERYLLFNNMTINEIRGSNAAQKMPDGSIFFNEANKQSLNFDLKVNDERSLQLHNKNGLTKISIRNPLNNQSGWQTYYTISEGFLQLLDMVTSSYIKQLTHQQIVSGYIYMPLISGTSVFIQTLINLVATIIFPLSLSLLLPVFLYNLVLEKQTKIVQMMRMNGLSILTYWMVNFLFNCFISLLTYGVFYLFGYFYMQTSFFLNTSALLFCIILIGWMLCQIGMSMIFQVVISNSRAANIIGYLITIWTNLIGATLSIAMYQYPVQMPFSVTLWPTIAFNRLFYLMFINCSADHCYDSFNSLPDQAIRCIIIIYTMAIIFMLLGMYLFQIIPQQFGVSKSVLFPFECLKKKKNFEEIHKKMIMSEEDEHQITKQCDELALEEVQKVKTNKFTDFALICDRLTKVYQNGKKATTDFSLILQDNQVFGLLGPNGAGKTTLISMITGIFSPSSGTAYVAGYNIETEIDSVHMNMGVCPQFDILWDELTVEEHLYFYARLRGTPSSLQKIKVEEILNEVALQTFARFKVKQLSGGMKRRLSVAISLVGDPRVVFLDQPTTGLDPENRRNLWELLAKCKNKRSLFLTTHLMDEAESLCDRIGIITNGRLRTVGNQMSLKKKYGNGYSLTISVQLQRDIFHQIRESYFDSIQNQEQEYQQSSSSYSQKSRISIMSVNQQPPVANFLVNDSIDSSNYVFDNKKVQRRMINNSNIIEKSRMRRDEQNLEDEHFELNIEYENKKYTIKQLECLNKYILERFSAEEFVSSSITSHQSNNTSCKLPEITKQLNGTVQFTLGHHIKISKVLQQLNRMKRMTISEIADYEHAKDNKQKHYDTVNDNGKDLLQFQWSINNSSLQEVFISVVKEFEQKQKSIKIESDQLGEL